MSHYTVMVALPPGSMDRIDPMLDEIMAPWDEGREVDAYKDHEDGEPGDYWFVKAMRRGAGHHRDGTGLIPYNPGMLGWSTAETKLTPQQQRDEFRRDAEAAEELGDSPDWGTVVTVHNTRFADDESDDLLYDPVAEKAYQWSTYNPDSKWDWWRIGGRWSGYFKIRAGISQSDQDKIIHNSQHHGDSPDLIEPGACDGGVISALDLAGMRTDAVKRAGYHFDKWQATLRTYPRYETPKRVSRRPRRRPSISDTARHRSRKRVYRHLRLPIRAVRG